MGSRVPWPVATLTPRVHSLSFAKAEERGAAPPLVLLQPPHIGGAKSERQSDGSNPLLKQQPNSTMVEQHCLSPPPAWHPATWTGNDSCKHGTEQNRKDVLMTHDRSTVYYALNHVCLASCGDGSWVQWQQWANTKLSD